MKFVDEAEIFVKAGKGGDGCVSFRREKYVPRGGPDGGDGGQGGSVWIQSKENLLTLYDLRLKKKYIAPSGKPGQGKQKNGRKGEDLHIYVPVGTLVFEIEETGEQVQIADLDVPGKKVLVAKGGRGGKGNIHFKSPVMRAPRIAEPGEEGEERHLKLELKLIADVGLIGLPNAGKSTFIARVSRARPKIAPYPFTTLTPQLGVVEGDFGDKLVIADIPGLIEGAHLGHGLGHRFLKHISRTKVLVHILSVEEISIDSPMDGFMLVDSELEKYDPDIASKEQIKLINKIDLLEHRELVRLKDKILQIDTSIYLISLKTGEGLDEVMKEIWKMAKGYIPVNIF